MLDKDGNECEVAFDGDKLCGLPEPSEARPSRSGRYYSPVFYPRADWIAEAITEARGLEAELEVLQRRLRDVEYKLDTVEMSGKTYHYAGDDIAQEFCAMLETFEESEARRSRPRCNPC